MKELQAILFDVDGTLADTEETHRQAFNRAFREFGLDWDWTPRLYAELLAISGGHERMRYFGRDLVSEFASEDAFEHFIADLHRVKTSMYADMLVSGAVPLRAGVRRLIDAARAEGVGMSIATSTAMSNVRTLLDCNLPADWPDWFTAIETCDSVAEKKPSPAVYAAVLAETGYDPKRCVAIEDTVNGLRAAVSAQLTTIVTTHYFTRHEHFPDAVLVLDSLGEPDAPCNVLGGNTDPIGYVNLDLLGELINRPVARATTEHWIGSNFPPAPASAA